MSSLLPRYFGIWYSFINLHVFRMGGEPMELEKIISWMRDLPLPEESVQFMRICEVIRRITRIISWYFFVFHVTQLILYMIFISCMVISDVHEMLLEMIWVGISSYFYFFLCTIKHFWSVLLRVERLFLARVPDNVFAATLCMTHYVP